jgi:uncharacterized DUF497 family protein
MPRNHCATSPESALKAKSNLLKHQVAFKEASSIIGDPQFITFLDD